jgi:hypothetical protein
VGLAQDLQELVEREADPPVQGDAAAPADHRHHGDEDVLIQRPRQTEVAVGCYLPVLLEAVALFGQDRVPGLGAVLAPFATLEHEERCLLQVDLHLDQRPALELEEP